MAAPDTEEAVCLISNVTLSLMENDVENNLNTYIEQQQQHEVEDEEEDEEVSNSSDSEIGDGLESLYSKEEDECSSFSLTSWRPNAHGGHHLHSSTLQPLANRNQKYSHHIRASPLEVFLHTLLPLSIHNCQ